MFERGDVVRVGKGKVEYTVLNRQLGTKAVDIESHNTGKASTVQEDRLVLVKAVEDIERDARPVSEDGPLMLTPQPKPFLAEVVEDVPLTGTVASEVPEHVPGESPAEYQKRTGQKLDGRRTSYGRRILAALQPKLFQTPKKVKAARRKARLNRAQVIVPEVQD